MSQQQIDAYRQQLLASYYYQQQQQQLLQQQQQLNSTPTCYYNMPTSPVQESAYPHSPSTMALLSGLQQQHQQEQKQRQLAVASPAPSQLTTTSSSVLPVPHQEKMAETPMLAPVRKPATTTAAAAPDYADEHAPRKAQKLKKKKSFLAKIAENNKNLSPKDPSFWRPRDAAQAKRFGRGAPKGTAQSKVKDVSSSPPPAVIASPSPAPLAQYQPQTAPPPYQAQAAASAAPSAVPSIPAPPFALPQIPAGGYLYYCPPTAQPEVVVSSPTAAAAAAAAANTPDPEPSAAQKPMYRVNATVYNPRQGNPGDRCTIM